MPTSLTLLLMKYKQIINENQFCSNIVASTLLQLKIKKIQSHYSFSFDNSFLGLIPIGSDNFQAADNAKVDAHSDNDQVAANHQKIITG